jgi:hypothetical protein
MSSYDVKWVNGHTNYKDTQSTMHIDTKRIWNMVLWTKVWETQMEGIDDIYKCNPCLRWEFNNVGYIATPIVDDYLWTKHVN